MSTLHLYNFHPYNFLLQVLSQVPQSSLEFIAFFLIIIVVTYNVLHKHEHMCTHLFLLSPVSIAGMYMCLEMTSQDWMTPSGDPSLEKVMSPSSSSLSLAVDFHRRMRLVKLPHPRQHENWCDYRVGLGQTITLLICYPEPMLYLEDTVLKYNTWFSLSLRYSSWISDCLGYWSISVKRQNN